MPSPIPRRWLPVVLLGGLLAIPIGACSDGGPNNPPAEDVDAYVTDYTLLLNALSLGTGDTRLAGAPFGAQDPYGIGLPKGSDGVAFVNAFLKKIEADGTWAKLWTISIGQRTGSTAVPTPPAIP